MPKRRENKQKTNRKEAVKAASFRNIRVILMKNKLIAALLISALILSLAACGDKNIDNETSTSETSASNAASNGEPERKEVAPLSVLTGEYSQWEWNDELEMTQVQTNCSCIKLSDECAKEYPDLAKVLAQSNADSRQKQQRTHAELITESQELLEETGTLYSPFESMNSVTVRRADSIAVSVLNFHSRNGGGAHSLYSYWGQNYDSKTGALLGLEDVVADMSALPGLVCEQLNVYYGDDIYEQADIDGIFASPEFVSWTVDYNGITFYFSPYEIAPYASGAQSVTLTFADNPGLVKPEYTEAPDCYAVSLLQSLPFRYDTNGDGELDEIIPSYFDYGDGEPIDYRIIKNKKTAEGETDGYGVDFTFVHTESGNYVYAEFLFDNDFRSTKVFDVSQEDIREVGETDFSMLRCYDYDEQINYRLILTNPESFKMSTTSYMLGTASVSGEFTVSADGMPETDDGFFTVENDFEFTLLTDLEVEIIEPETGAPSGKSTVKSGAKVKYYRTDNDDEADLILADGRIGRVTVQSENWIRMIDGVDVEEIFDGLLFAG